MNNVLIYFCANVQILIRPGTIVFTKSDLTPDEKRRISPRFDRAPDVSPVFSQDSTFHLPRGRIREKHSGSQSYINRFVVPLASVKQIMDLNQ